MIRFTHVINWLLLLLTLGFQDSYAQNSSTVFQLERLPINGLTLDRCWRFQAGDNPSWANSNLNDRHWTSIDPTKAIQDVPQIEQAGISWLRLHITTGQDLPPLVCYMFQSVASDVYLDGRLLYRFGTISSNPYNVRAYNPYAAFSLPLQPATQHVLAIRIAYQPGLDYKKIYFGRLPSALRYNLFPAAEIPAIPIFNIESVYLDSFRVGLSFILCILHLSLFIAYRQQRANLYAAGMYALMGCQAVLRAASDLMHSIEARTILGYSTYASPCINGLMLLIFYNLFCLQKRWPFWLTIGTISLAQFQLPSTYSWLTILISYWLTLELIRVSALAIRRQQLGARIIIAGVICNVGLSIIFWIVFAYKVPISGHEWLYHNLYIIQFLSIPLALSLRLSLEHGWINQRLNVKLQEVEELSAQNLAQQQNRQELLTKQNEVLERLVEERTRELHLQATHLKELDNAKSRFFTNLTHEFRTPLSLIILPVSKLLKTSTLTDTQQTILQTVDRNARHLLDQVNQLLDLARLEDGSMRITRQPVHVGQVTTQIMELFEASALAAQISLQFTIFGEEHTCLMDTDKWVIIVHNLLANALKFTPEGGQIKVMLNLNNDIIRLEVNDTGIGIASDKLPFIFDRFYQVDDHLARPFEGTGVGLALARELTVLLGGHLTATSQLGEGTTFCLTLPNFPAPSNAEAVDTNTSLSFAVNPHSTHSIPQLGNHSRTTEDDRALILVVEDNIELRRFIVDDLSKHYRVLAADNGEIGWEVVRQELPDIVISDVMMPRLDGFQLASLIKSTPSTDHIAIVLLTARSTYESRMEGLGQGVDEYLVKPFDLDELQLRIANILVSRQTLQRYYRRQVDHSVEQQSGSSQLPDDPFLERIYALLEAHLENQTINVEWLANQLSMDRKTLYRKLQSKLQLSPNALIRLYRLQQASILLRTGKNVSDVAFMVGFESVSYFGLSFKEEFGMTPSEYKTKNALT